MPTTTESTRTVTKGDVEKGKVTTAIIPYVQNADEEDKEPEKIEVKLPNGNKVYLPFIKESADPELFLTRSIAAKLNLTKDLKMQFQAEELERVIKNIRLKLPNWNKILVALVHSNNSPQTPPL
jgi:hypothetical protein